MPTTTPPMAAAVSPSSQFSSTNSPPLQGGLGASAGSPTSSPRSGSVVPPVMPPLSISNAQLPGNTTNAIFASPSPRKMGASPSFSSIPPSSSNGAILSPSHSNSSLSPSNPTMAHSASATGLTSSNPQIKPVSNPPPSGQVYTGPNPSLFQTGSPSGSGTQARPTGPSGYYYSPGVGGRSSNPAIAPNSTSPVPGAKDGDVIDIRSLMPGFSSPALSPAIPKQTFPTYQSPHVTTPPPSNPKANTVIYSPVLSKPLPIQSATPDTTQKMSQPMYTPPTTTISILPLPSDSNTINTRLEPTPTIIMDILSTPMEASSPFDDIPFD